MSKRIVYCSDGTWDAPLNGTNVYRMYKALAVSSDQVTFYDDGIGADATGLARLLEGAFATSINQKVQMGYTKIAHVYEPGDQIYLFGFSRGAYTARCIGGMIANCGLPSGSFTDDCVTQAFNAYRNPGQRAGILASLGACGLADAVITMIGVWDTVGALGIPAIFGGIDVDKFGFLDLNIHPDVKNAFHCLAIDEQRAQFPATLWNVPNPPNPGQTIEQVWFSGCHSDIGGGTPPGGTVDSGTRLCDITMAYMVGKAKAMGLTFDPAAPAYDQLDSQYALDLITESWAAKDGPPHHRPIDPKANISNSVAIRIQYALTYQPVNLTITDGALADTYTQLDLLSPTVI